MAIDLAYEVDEDLSEEELFPFGQTHMLQDTIQPIQR